MALIKDIEIAINIDPEIVSRLDDELRKAGEFPTIPVSDGLELARSRMAASLALSAVHLAQADKQAALLDEICRGTSSAGSSPLGEIFAGEAQETAFVSSPICHPHRLRTTGFRCACILEDPGITAKEIQERVQEIEESAPAAPGDLFYPRPAWTPAELDKTENV